MDNSSMKANLERRLVAKAMKDDNFRNDLIANPKAVIEKELGVAVPESMQVCVLQESPTDVYLVLPAKASLNEELTEQELMAVAGGSDIWSSDSECETCGPGCFMP